MKSLMKYCPHEELTLVGGRYKNGRQAIRAVNSEGEHLATLTVNIPELPLKEGEMFIKDWGENEGALLTLVNAGLAELIEIVPTGFCFADKIKWLGGELS